MSTEAVYTTCRQCKNLIQLTTIPSVFKDNLCPDCAGRQLKSCCGCSTSFMLLFALTYLTFDKHPLYPWVWLWIAIMGIYLVFTKIAGWLSYGCVIAGAPLAYALSRTLVIAVLVLGVTLYAAYVWSNRQAKDRLTVRHGGMIERMKSLLADGADINAVEDGTDDTALIIAVRNGDIASVKALVAAGADVKYQKPHRGHGGYPQSAMSIAVGARNTEIIDALFNAGADGQDRE